MKFEPTFHHRRSIRLSRYDYTRAGAYFITLCVHQKQCIFGRIQNGEMRLNAHGRAVADEWLQTATIRDAVELDEWVVMPNHFHGILFIGSKGTARRAPTPLMRERYGNPVSGSVPTIVRSFKSAATRRVNMIRSTPGEELWQRNYWERVVRNESELNVIREYIRTNAASWESDRLYEPDNIV
jgi:putative transposase